MGTIELQEFSIPQGTFARILLLRHLHRTWWIYAMPVAACAALAFLDVRFLLVALMVVFIMIPMALLLVYINHGLDPVNRYNIMRKSLTADADKLTMAINEEYGLKNKNVTFNWNEIDSRHRISSHCLLLNLRTARHRFIAIPISSFADERQLRSFLGYLNGKETETQAER